MTLTERLTNVRKRRRYAAEQRSFRTVLLKVDSGLRNELIEMHHCR